MNIKIEVQPIDADKILRARNDDLTAEERITGPFYVSAHPDRGALRALTAFCRKK